jgi:hypothetical protein
VLSRHIKTPVTVEKLDTVGDVCDYSGKDEVPLLENVLGSVARCM